MPAATAAWQSGSQEPDCAAAAAATAAADQTSPVSLWLVDERSKHDICCCVKASHCYSADAATGLGVVSLWMFCCFVLMYGGVTMLARLRHLHRR